jgi:hypothetical protein
MERFVVLALRVLTWPSRMLEATEMRIYLVGQNFVGYQEVKAMFPETGYPAEIYQVLSAARSKPGTTRQDVLRAFRSIAARNRCGAKFAAALDPAELASLDKPN